MRGGTGVGKVMSLGFGFDVETEQGGGNQTVHQFVGQGVRGF